MILYNKMLQNGLLDEEFQKEILNNDEIVKAVICHEDVIEEEGNVEGK